MFAMLQFPVFSAIRVIGRNTSDFEALAVDLVRMHAPELDISAVSSRPSRDGNYLAVTIPLTIIDREQMEAIYQQLSMDKRVLMTL